MHLICPCSHHFGLLVRSHQAQAYVAGAKKGRGGEESTKSPLPYFLPPPPTLLMHVT